MQEQEYYSFAIFLLVLVLFLKIRTFADSLAIFALK